MTLNHAEAGREYIVRAIQTDDEEMDAFLFSLGCFSGQPITVIAPCAMLKDLSGIMRSSSNSIL